MFNVSNHLQSLATRGRPAPSYSVTTKLPGQPQAFLVAKEAFMTRKIKLFAVLLGALVMFGGAGAVQASDRDRDDACYRKINKEERELGRAIRKHGYYSRQADNERRELARLQNECGRRWR
jgi:hypothetical protein